MSDTDEFIADFLEECAENLDQLEQELVALEDSPADANRLQSIFRTIHTIKGSSGFFGFAKLGALTHDGETLLGLIRDGVLSFSQPRASALLKMSDAVREMTLNIEQTGGEGGGDYSVVSNMLQALMESDDEDLSPKTSQLSVEPVQAITIDDVSAAPSSEPHATDKALDSDESALPALTEAVSDQPVRSDSSDTSQTQSPTEQPAASVRSTKSPSENTSIRVDVAVLDELMDLASELVLVRNQLSQHPSIADDRDLSVVTGHLSQVTSMLQDRVMRTRMQPISVVFSKFNRIVRDLAVSCEKQIRLELDGEDTELDRALLDAIRDPLTHLVRNSVDHGIEMPDARIAAGKDAEGKLLLRASHQSGQVIIEAIDDGGGIDVTRVREKAVQKGLISAHEAARIPDGRMLQYIFAPGFSTAQQVSSISGRGVGMDVVKNNIERIGGSVDLISEAGVGTTLRITIPLTLAIVPSLSVRSAGRSFVIPQASLHEVILIEDFEKVQDVPVYRLRDRLLPLVWLDALLETAGVTNPMTGYAPDTLSVGGGSLHVVVLQAEEQRFGLIVDEVLSSQEVVVKPIGSLIKSIGVYSASTLLGDGTISLILDISGIAKRAGLIGHAGEKPQVTIDDVPPEASAIKQSNVSTWLVCATSQNREIAISLGSIERLHELTVSDIQHSEAGWFASYRGNVMPVISIGENLGLGDPEGIIPIIVHRRGNHLVGAAVERVVDVIESDHEVTPPTSQGSSSVVGITIVGGRPIEVVDLDLLHSSIE